MRTTTSSWVRVCKPKVNEYIGEWTGVAAIGQSLIALAFGASFVSLVSFFEAERPRRKAFAVMPSTPLPPSPSFLCWRAPLEFQYIWKHLNNEMPMRFILVRSGAVEEGGFLLWMFWYNVLGLLLLRTDSNAQRRYGDSGSNRTVPHVHALGVYFETSS